MSQVLLQQDQLKQKVAQAAVEYMLHNLAPGSVVGVGTGSTVNFFIDAMANHKARWREAVSSSEASTARLQAHGFSVLSLNDVAALPIYVDGADEITPEGHMTKGGGAALTREKIIASVAQTFVCIADESKKVEHLGQFPIPIEVIPMARESVIRHVMRLFTSARIVSRKNADGSFFSTDNHCEILDISGLKVTDAVVTERAINQIPGVVTVGIFAQRGANILLVGGAQGVQTQYF